MTTHPFPHAHAGPYTDACPCCPPTAPFTVPPSVPSLSPPCCTAILCTHNMAVLQWTIVRSEEKREGL